MINKEPEKTKIKSKVFISCYLLTVIINEEDLNNND